MQSDTRRFLPGKTLKRLLPIFMILLGGCASEPGSESLEYPPVDVDMKLVQVSKHVYFVQGKAGAATQNKGFISNAGFVVTGDGIVVFDALGTPSLAQKFLGKIRAVTNAPIRKVVMSHYHADHVYGLQVFKDLGAEIIAPDGARDYLNSPVADNLLETRRKELKPWVDERTHLVPADDYLTKDAEFTLGGIHFRTILQGMAHSEGDMAMLVEPDNVLFTGDIIFEGRIPFIGEANTRNWLKRLEQLQSVNVAALIPGHGPMAKDPNKLIRFTHRYLSFLREKMGKAVDAGVTFDQAYDEIDWSEFEYEPAFFEANRRNAYNVYLAMQKEWFN
jgi:glyoxylase-like metal-dependent hydrolase (beta-lactamase superfamily II)